MIRMPEDYQLESIGKVGRVDCQIEAGVCDLELVRRGGAVEHLRLVGIGEVNFDGPMDWSRKNPRVVTFNPVVAGKKAGTCEVERFGRLHAGLSCWVGAGRQ